MRLLLALFAFVSIATPAQAQGQLVSRTELPEQVRAAMQKADEAAIRTMDVRKDAAKRAFDIRLALVKVLSFPDDVKVEEFISIYDDFLLALTDAIADDEELKLADANVMKTHFEWRSKLSKLDLKAEQAFTKWLAGVTDSYFTPPADAISLMERGQKKMAELISAEHERTAKEREKDDLRMKEWKDLIERIIKKQ